MSDITLAADQTAVTRLLHDAESILGMQSKSTSGSFGPFFAQAGASVSFSGGSVTLTPPKTIELANVSLNYALSLSFGIDLSKFLPNFCLPQVIRDRRQRQLVGRIGRADAAQIHRTCARQRQDVPPFAELPGWIPLEADAVVRQPFHHLHPERGAIDADRVRFRDIITKAQRDRRRIGRQDRPDRSTQHCGNGNNPPPIA